MRSRPAGDDVLLIARDVEQVTDPPRRIDEVLGLVQLGLAGRPLGGELRLLRFDRQHRRDDGALGRPVALRRKRHLAAQDRLDGRHRHLFAALPDADETIGLRERQRLGAAERCCAAGRPRGLPDFPFLKRV